MARSRLLTHDACGTYASLPMHDRSATWRVIKAYGHDEGLSCAFRQWQARHSHCRFLHGYALAFRFTFACTSLDDRAWCVDFGSLKPLRAWLHDTFDHTLLAARGDPQLHVWRELDTAGLARLVVLDEVGCEAFASLAHRWASDYIAREASGRVWLEQVDVGEHAGNAASFTPATRIS